MGKAYLKELAALGPTLEWAKQIPIESLTDFVSEAHGHPLVAVGSGGSATAAHLAALLHRAQSYSFARHATPLDVLLSDCELGSAAVLMLSASGKNRDALATVRHCIKLEAGVIATLSTRVGTALGTIAKKYARSYVFEAAVPSGKDGFLATNSLLATCALLTRAYTSQLQFKILPRTRERFCGISNAHSTVLILHGGWGSPVATDLESKLHESALACVQTTDFRNFGHGRHLWLSTRGDQTLVILLVTPETKDLAERTRALIPANVSRIQIETQLPGPCGTLELLVQGFELVGAFGKLHGVDPGRPKVPAFGRKLFRLTRQVSKMTVPAPIVRKTARVTSLDHDVAATVSALNKFVSRLRSLRIGGLVFDYDGTLCGRAERFGRLRADLARELKRLIRDGLIVGIATGRGRSVRLALQKALPRDNWNQVVVGYYNAGEVANMSAENVPDRTDRSVPPLDQAFDLLKDDPQLCAVASLTARRFQITVEPKRGALVSTELLLPHVMTTLSPVEHLGVRVLASSHSVDVLAPGISKLTVVEYVQSRIAKGTEVLCVGDRGRWPGNDCALLSHTPSLSVDQVSSSLLTCWNLAPLGVVGPDATLAYLKRITVTNAVGMLNPANLWGSA